MATGGGYPSISRDSEEVFESECFNCSQEGKHVQAEVFCVECGDNLCRGCLEDHNEFAKLRTHTIRDKSAVKQSTTQGLLHPPTEKCLEHHGRLIDTFCVNHDVVCCSVCVSVDHKSCTDVKYLPTVASGTSTSKNLQDAQTTTKSVKKQLEWVKTMRQGNLSNVRMQGKMAMERASEETQQLVNIIEELGEKTTSEIMEKYKKLEEAINKDLDELNKSIVTFEDTQSQLQNPLNDETKLFVHVKQSKRVISTGRKLVESCLTNAGVGCCTFVVEDSIKMYLRNLNSLGSFEEDLEYSSVHVSDKNIKSSKDMGICDITEICSLSGMNLMIADEINNCLKKLNKALQIESRCGLTSKPNAVCQTSSTELAVTMWNDKKIQFVSVGQTISLTRSFKLEGDGYSSGIACKDGQLYVGRRKWRSGYIQVYNTSGTLFQTINKDKSGTSIFKHPNQIAINVRTSNIYIADFDNGLIILDKSGQLVAKITDPDLRKAEGVCVLPGDQVLVCGYGSHNIIQFDSRGRKVRTLLTAADGLKQPQNLYFDPRTFKLIVGMESSNEIKVFSLLMK